MAVNDFGAIRRLTARFKGRSRVHADWAAKLRFVAPNAPSPDLRRARPCPTTGHKVQGVVPNVPATDQTETYEE